MARERTLAEARERALALSPDAVEGIVHGSAAQLGAALGEALHALVLRATGFETVAASPSAPAEAASEAERLATASAQVQLVLGIVEERRAAIYRGAQGDHGADLLIELPPDVRSTVEQLDFRAAGLRMILGLLADNLKG